MTQLILHHFDASPFAEKIRIILGIKNLSWSSVQIPMIMPKPLLTALTGGYRKTPVLQIGADIYCDTLLISDELSKRFPEPTLYPNGGPGLSLALGRWSDKAFFEPGAALSMGENPQVPDAVIDDRKAFFNFMDFDQLVSSLPDARRRLQAHAALVERSLASRADFLEGTKPGYQDVLAWFVIWMVNANVPSAESLLAPFPRLRAWAHRMSAIGHGHVNELSAEEAIEIARLTTPDASGAAVRDNPLGLTAGQRVAVKADDYGQDPVVGELLNLDFERITLRSRNQQTDIVHVHFPVIGYDIIAAENC